MKNTRKIRFNDTKKIKSEKISEIICPFCFRKFLPSEVFFRAMHSVNSDNKYKLQQDILLNRYREKLSLNLIPEIEAVIDPKDIYEENKKSVKGVLLEVIDNYGVRSKKRLCPYCHNEMPSSLGKGPACIISVIGSPKVGKSTFMTVLLHTLQYSTAANMNAECYFTNSRYRYLLKEYESSLYIKEKRLNSDIKEDSIDHLVLIFKLKDSEVPVTLIFYDVSSESMLDRKHMDTFAENIKNSEGIIFLIDPMELEKLREEYHVENEISYNPVDVVSHLFENFISEQENEENSIPTAFVLTKTDKLLKEKLIVSSQMFSDFRHKGYFNLTEFNNIHKEVEKFIQENDAHFFNTIISYFKKYGFFGVSAISEVEGEKGDKISVEPKRIDEPLLWIMYQLGYLSGGD